MVDSQWVSRVSEGLPVGISEDQKYNQGEITLKTGDIMMLYTDGITEAMNEKRDQFSLDKVKEIIQTNKSKSAEDIGKNITKEIDEFVGVIVDQQRLPRVLKIRMNEGHTSVPINGDNRLLR